MNKQGGRSLCHLIYLRKLLSSLEHPKHAGGAGLLGGGQPMPETTFLQRAKPVAHTPSLTTAYDTDDTHFCL